MCFASSVRLAYFLFRNVRLCCVYRISFFLQDQCPLDNNCLITSVIYKANVTTDKDNTGKNYIGLTEGTFKQRYTQHNLTFRNRKYASRTELAKHIWKLKDNEENYKITWSIISSASAYNNISKRCNLCLTEKLHIIKADKARNLNKRTELISKCRHENKYFIANIDLTNLTCLGLY